MLINDNNIPLSEYPREILKRDSYLCLNGLWDFKISKSDNINQEFDLKIMVPYCVESSLSTINKQIEKDDFLLYKRNINIDKKFIKDKVILHLDGVDQVATIYINKEYVFQTLTNYLPNEIDITSFIKEGLNEIIIVIKDDRNKVYPYGKQADNISGMWYSQVSGIFKTIWLESVSNDYIKELKITPNIDNKSVTFNITSLSDSFKIFIYKDNKCIYKNHFKEKEFTIFLDEIILWDVDNPFLYKVVLCTKNDEVSSYFAMRKFEAKNNCFYLNNKKIFIYGLLDQGYFIDGIFTPQSYNEYEKDIKLAKDLGYNCLRKHIKVEPLYFYYLCDKLGILVFQDFINNGKYSFFKDTILPTIGFKNKIFKDNENKSEQYSMFKLIGCETIKLLYNFPSVVYYTIFNEGWGEHNPDYYYQLVKELDNTRVIDATSGWFYGKKSDVLSLHVYFKKIKLTKSDLPIIVSEFGGYAYKVKGHVYAENKFFGYKRFNNQDDYDNAIYNLYKNDIINNIKNGLAGCIYTQISDVYDEVNGLITFDRKVLKVNKDTMLKIKNEIDKEFYNE